MNVLKVCLSLFLAIFFIAGCSSGPSDQELETVVTDYISASEDKNWAGVCENISSQSEQSIIDNSGQLSCQAGYEALPKKGQQSLSDIAKGSKFSSVKINGDKAIAEVETTGGIAEVPLVVENGSWKVHLFK